MAGRDLAHLRCNKDILSKGSSSREYYCLPDLCGWLAVGGGDADSEITYELDAASGDPFYGVAPPTDYCASSRISCVPNLS